MFDGLISDDFEEVFSSVDDIADWEIIAKVLHKEIPNIFVVLEDTTQVRTILKFFPSRDLQLFEDDSKVVAILKISSAFEVFI